MDSSLDTWDSAEVALSVLWPLPLLFIILLTVPFFPQRVAKLVEIALLFPFAPWSLGFLSFPLMIALALPIPLTIAATICSSFLVTTVFPWFGWHLLLEEICGGAVTLSVIGACLSFLLFGRAVIQYLNLPKLNTEENISQRLESERNVFMALTALGLWAFLCARAWDMRGTVTMVKYEIEEEERAEINEREVAAKKAKIEDQKRRPGRRNRLSHNEEEVEVEEKEEQSDDEEVIGEEDDEE